MGKWSVSVPEFLFVYEVSGISKVFQRFALESRPTRDVIPALLLPTPKRRMDTLEHMILKREIGCSRMGMGWKRFVMQHLRNLASRDYAICMGYLQS